MEEHCCLLMLHAPHTEHISTDWHSYHSLAGSSQVACISAWLVHADTRTCYSDVPPYSSRPESSAQKALDALFLAAPVKGEVQPWVWLLRAVAATHGLDSVHDSICYLVGPKGTGECT